jgi:indole-3-glycerol phosphate synthase
MSGSGNLLHKIIASKRTEVAALRERCPEESLREQAMQVSSRRDFVKALCTAREDGSLAIIAELKRASPSAGQLREDYVPEQIASDYEQGGAHCLSVLTDTVYFRGSHEHLQSARAACTLAVLRKDFIVDSYQIYQSLNMGADAVLLIAGAFENPRDLSLLAELSICSGLSVLLEIHDAKQWREHQTLAESKQVLVGINNRDLRTLEIDLNTTRRLAHDVAMLSPNPVIAESGISTAEEMIDLHAHGAHGFLIGSALMGAKSPGQALRALLDSARISATTES